MKKNLKWPLMMSWKKDDDDQACIVGLYVEMGGHAKNMVVSMTCCGDERGRILGMTMMDNIWMKCSLLDRRCYLGVQKIQKKLERVESAAMESLNSSVRSVFSY
jgi:hypothetical protein